MAPMPEAAAAEAGTAAGSAAQPPPPPPPTPATPGSIPDPDWLQDEGPVFLHWAQCGVPPSDGGNQGKRPPLAAPDAGGGTGCGR
mmetsp:Transcript_28217/g.67013  ORF Transcript_28217/g.67013 Transcript_28217/m.67013 type:complete len:85 (-) Transcript_28217:867-1121(-)